MICHTRIQVPQKFKFRVVHCTLHTVHSARCAQCIQLTGHYTQCLCTGHTQYILGLLQEAPGKEATLSPGDLVPTTIVAHDTLTYEVGSHTAWERNSSGRLRIPVTEPSPQKGHIFFFGKFIHQNNAKRPWCIAIQDAFGRLWVCCFLGSLIFFWQKKPATHVPKLCKLGRAQNVVIFCLGVRRAPINANDGGNISELEAPGRRNWQSGCMPFLIACGLSTQPSCPSLSFGKLRGTNIFLKSRHHGVWDGHRLKGTL